MQVNAGRQGSDKVERSGSCFETLSIAFTFLVIGAGLSYWGWTILENARASTSWPMVEGQIIQSQVKYSRDGDGHDSYKPEITYTYLVNNRSFKSYAIKFGENSYDNKRAADEVADKYPTGKKVAVYYDPKNPDNSVLEPGVSSGSYIVFGIGVLFVAIALIVPPVSHFLCSRSA